MPCREILSNGSRPITVIGSVDRTLRLWPAYADATMLCDKLTTNMSHQQWPDWVSPDIDYIEALSGPSHPTGWVPLRG